MKDEIIEALKKIGFTITDETDLFIAGEVESFNNGTFIIEVHLKTRTFSVRLDERFSSLSIFFCQTFYDADHIICLLEGNYPFQELIIENCGTLKKMFNEFIRINS